MPRCPVPLAWICWARWSASALTILVGAGCSPTVDTIAAEPTSSGQAGTQDSTPAATDVAVTTASDATMGGRTTGGTAEGTATSTTSAPTGSCAQIDVLLVVDNTPDNLGVVQSLQSNLGDLGDRLATVTDDFHLGVVPTQTTGDSSVCRVSGALTNEPLLTCSTANDTHWGTAADSAEVLSCLGNLDLTDADEFRTVAQAAGRGLGARLSEDAVPPDAALDACNDGFLRAEAATVLVVLASDDDLGSPETPAQWRQQLFEDAPAPEIVLSVLPTSDAGAGCPGPADNLIDWLGEHGSEAPIDWCASPQNAVAAVIGRIDAQLQAYCT